MTNKTEYPQFSINRLIKKWPFSLELAKDIFYQNQYGYISSLRNFFDFTAFEEYENAS